MRALKGLVIGMGVLIAVGLTIVVVTIAMRLTGPEGAEGQRAAADGGDTTPGSGAQGPGAQGPGARGPGASAPGPRPFGELQLGMADSCRIAGAAATGGTLVVRLDGPGRDGCGQLVVVDPARGRVLGRIRPGAAGDPDSAEVRQ